jgi:hypothetical protein
MSRILRENTRYMRTNNTFCYLGNRGLICWFNLVDTLGTYRIVSCGRLVVPRGDS